MNGSATIATNESVDGVIIIRGDVVVDGTVREGLMVYDGTATINGAVGGDIVIVSGNLVLGAGSSVKDIMLVRSDITQDPTATVDGEIQESSGDLTLGRGFLIFSILWFIGTVIAGMVAAIFFGWLGRAQLFGSVETLRSNVVGSLVTAIVLFIVLPLAAGLIVFTLVGAPLGLGIPVLLPILLALGLIVFGAWIASYLIKGSSTAAAVGTAVLGRRHSGARVVDSVRGLLRTSGRDAGRRRAGLPLVQTGIDRRITPTVLAALKRGSAGDQRHMPADRCGNRGGQY
ncbi:MAG: hypothetical protein R2839_01130 [Thermomicrobiales bacterium]